MQYLTNRVKRIEKSLKPKDGFQTFLGRVMGIIGEGNGVIPSRDRFDDDAFRQLCEQFPAHALELGRQVDEIQVENKNEGIY